MTDPLTPLLELADVQQVLEGARAAVDRALRHPALRRSGGQTAAEAGLRSAVASAALSGHRYDLSDVRSGTVTDPVLQGALRVSQEIDELASLWRKVPRQVLARVHVLAARDVVDPGQLGRPADPTTADRLATLMSVVAGASSVPALLVATVVHGELLALRPFRGPAGVVARAAARITLVAWGLDPRGLLAVDVGHLAREPEYVGCSNAFASGTPDGIRAWIRHCANAVTLAAEEVTAIGDAIVA